MPMVGMAITGALGLGAKAGMVLGGVMGIVGVAVNLLITHWDKLMDVLGQGKVMTEADEMEALGKKTARTAEETAKLNEHKRQQAAIESMMKGESKKERATEQATQEGYNEADPDKVAKALGGAFRGRMGPTPAETEEIERQMALERITGTPEIAEKNVAPLRDAIAKRLDAAADAAAKALMEQAKHAGPQGDLARKQMQAMLPKDMAERMALASPEQAGIVEAETAAERAALRADEERMAQNKALTEQGRENEQAMLDERRQRREHEAGRLAGAMDRSVGTGLLLDPKMGQAALMAKIHESLQQSGMERAGVASEDLDKLARDIAVRMREKMEHAVEGRAAERGISTEEARVQLLKEEQQQDVADRKRAAGSTALMSNEEYANRLLVATQGGQREDRIPQEQLQAQKDAVKRLDELVKAAKARKDGDGVARFARGAARP